MNSEKGYLVISLDFELLWGVFDKIKLEDRKKYFHNTRMVIPELLELFEKNDVSCTWAIVGMLFNHNWSEWENNVPKYSPEYINSELSAYNFGNLSKSSVEVDLCFAPKLIQKIQNTPSQEIGTHTYSHYYCLEPGQIVDAFRSDLIKAKELAGEYNIKLNSLVFPRNQFNEKYLDGCIEAGLRSIRINPDTWYWKNTQKDRLLDKVFRTGDAYFGLQDKSYRMSEIKTYKDSLVLQKASRFLRPYKEGFQNELKMKRIKNEMIHAAKNAKIYHLWWHPHNFGNHPVQAIEELKEIIETFHYCKRVYNFQSANMNDITDIILN